MSAVSTASRRIEVRNLLAATIEGALVDAGDDTAVSAWPSSGDDPAAGVWIVETTGTVRPVHFGDHAPAEDVVDVRVLCRTAGMDVNADAADKACVLVDAVMAATAEERASSLSPGVGVTVRMLEARILGPDITANGSAGWVGVAEVTLSLEIYVSC